MLGVAFGMTREFAPLITGILVAGRSGSALAARLGTMTISQEIDALRVMGINPIQALVVPRVLAATLVSTMLAALVTMVGIAGSFLFSVYFQNVTPGAFASGLTLLVGLPQVVACLVKAALFGLAAGLIGCFKGISVGGGPQGVGDAVNETVVYTFMALFVIDVLATVVEQRITYG